MIKKEVGLEKEFGLKNNWSLLDNFKKPRSYIRKGAELIVKNKLT